MHKTMEMAKKMMAGPNPPKEIKVKNKMTIKSPGKMKGGK
jgi:hypothetical protein